jgi:hypothetical protein
VFETESAIALAGAHLTDVVTVWPDRDGYAEHSSDAAGGRPFSLFRPLKAAPHILYLAHDRVFDVAKDASIEIAIELGTPGSHPVAAVWEYWDGQVWQTFKEFDPANTAASQDGTAGFTRSGTVSLQLTCGRPAKTTVAGIKAVWIRARTSDPLPPDPVRVFAAIDRVRARAIVNQPQTLELNAAYAGTLKIDVTSTFYPFGLTATQGDVFYFANDEAFGKGGASVDVSFDLTAQVPLAYQDTAVRWQYWNGERWMKIPGVNDALYFAVSGASSLALTVPADIARVEVNGDTKFWLRAQVVRGGYFYRNQVKVTGPPDQTVEIIEPAGPAIESVLVGYRWRPAFNTVQHCTTDNDFQFELLSRAGQLLRALQAACRRDAGAVPGIRSAAAQRPDQSLCGCRGNGGTGSACHLGRLGR